MTKAEHEEIAAALEALAAKLEQVLATLVDMTIADGATA